MSTHPLDNPIWSSLDSRHAGIAIGRGGVLRYPRDVAPFIGVPEAHAAVDADTLASLVAAGDTVYLLGTPPALPAGWLLKHEAMLAQMICPARVASVDHSGVIELGDAHRDDVLALTALVYPHYFRPRTMALGRYFGLYVDGRLAAMIGERMGMPGHREISAVCSHPDFAGQGHARLLLAFLGNDLHARGDLPFLHVSQQNLRAVRLYEQNGFHLRREIAFWSLRRG